LHLIKEERKESSNPLGIIICVALHFHLYISIWVCYFVKFVIWHRLL